MVSRAAACVAIAIAASAAAAAEPIRIALTVPAGAEAVLAGARLGAEEGQRTASLLGRDVQLIEGESAGAAAVIDATALPLLRITDRFIIEVRRDGAVAWHPDLRRYGAGELNERFREATGQPMAAEAWAAWLAVKLIVESELRGRDLATLRIDGHKGVALRFDAEGKLEQPMYRIDAKGKLRDD